MKTTIGDIIASSLESTHKERKALASDLGVSYRQIQRLLSAQNIELKTLLEISKHIPIPPLHFRDGEIHKLEILSDKEPLAEALAQLKPEYLRVVMILVMELLRNQNPPKAEEKHPHWESYTRDDLDKFFLVERYQNQNYGDRSDDSVRRLDRKEKVG